MGKKQAEAAADDAEQAVDVGAAAEPTSPKPKKGKEAAADAPEGGFVVQCEGDDTVHVNKDGSLFRTYTRELNGDDFKALAEEFAAKQNGKLSA